MADCGLQTQSGQADSSELNLEDSMDTIGEPEPKKLKSEPVKDQTTEYKLEEKLTGILCCTVCLDVSGLSMFQCTNGHLMCASCLSHVLADARLKDETATCPGCRCEISRTLVTRNLAVEKAVSELPVMCQYCIRPLARGIIGRHERELCQERPVRCMYWQLGCQWSGPFNKQHSHELTCAFPNKPSIEILEPLRHLEEQKNNEVKLYKQFFDLMSFEKVTINDLQLKPYRTDDFIPKLFYESNRFSALALQWSVKARVNDHSPENPVHTLKRSFGFQLLLKSKPAAGVASIPVAYMALKGPFGESPVLPSLYEFDFGTDAQESPYRELPLTDYQDCNRLLSAKIINLRLILVQIPK